jgi:hypothetical protein
MSSQDSMLGNHVRDHTLCINGGVSEYTSHSEPDDQSQRFSMSDRRAIGHRPKRDRNRYIAGEFPARFDPTSRVHLAKRGRAGFFTDPFVARSPNNTG